MRPAAVAGTILLAALFGTTGASANEAAPAKARITSVVFEQLSGGAPVVTISGSGFGAAPSPRPSYRPMPPQGTSPPYGCSATGKVGWDYGTRLWISFKSPGKPLWSAGRYRPGLQELDCVGISILRYSGNVVLFRLGAGYRAFHFKIRRGDEYTASVKGAVKHGTVS